MEHLYKTTFQGSLRWEFVSQKRKYVDVLKTQEFVGDYTDSHFSASFCLWDVKIFISVFFKWTYVIEALF